MATPHLNAHAMVAQSNTHPSATYTCLPKCLHVMNETRLIMTHVPSPCRLHYPMQVPMSNKSQVNLDSYHTTRSLCDKHDRVSSLGNRTFRLTPWVSYTHTKLFGSHRRSLTPMFQAFHLKGLTVPFLLRPTHINYIYFYVLNRETFIGRRPKYELTTHSPTQVNTQYHASTPDSTRCDHAYEMHDANAFFHVTCIYECYMKHLHIMNNYNFFTYN